MGLPDDNVTGVVQTPEGYLWVATHNGLARFDGMKFQLRAFSRQSTPLVRTLMLGQDDSLWLALEIEGGMVVRLSNEATNVFTAAAGVPAFKPMAMAQDNEGAVWVSYADGSTCRIAGGKVTRYTAANGLPNVLGVCWVIADAQGRIWFTKAGRVGLFREGAFETKFTFEEQNVRLVSARDGGMWILAGKRLLKTDGLSDPVLLGEIETALVGVEPSVLFEDRDGGVWLGTTAGGLFYWDGRKIVAAETSHRDITGIIQDREGNLWVGTGGGGLDRLRNRVLEMQGPDVGLPFDSTRTVCEDGAGEMWAAGANGVLARTENGRWKKVEEGEGWTGARATCVVSDGRDGVWIGTYRGGLFHYTDGKFTMLGHDDGLAGETVRALLLDSQEDLWIGLETSNCVQRLSGGKFQNFAVPVTSHAVRVMAEDAKGNIWMGTQDGNLFRVVDEMLLDETPRESHPRKPIRALHATPDGALWVGLAGVGLGRLHDGKFATVGMQQGLLDDYICGIETDDKGGMWLSSGHGIFQVRLRTLEEVAEGRISRTLSIVYGRNESLPNIQGSYGYAPMACRSRDGRIWFATRSGVVVVNVDRLQPSYIPPKLLVERVLVDGVPAKLSPVSGKFILPPEHRKMEIEFTAFCYAAPEDVLFRYKLHGWDRDWVEAGTQRKVAYSRLPAGEYEFVLTACNNAGVWSEAVGMVQFVVEPFFWQRWWFRLAGVSAFTLGVVGIVRYVSFRRLRARVVKLEHEAALNKERARIAKDIHDDVGASFTQISLLGELARSDMATPDKAGEHVQKITAIAREGLNTLDEIVWAVNPNNDTLSHFLDYAGQYGVDFLRSANVRCRIDFPPQPPALNLAADMRHGLFLVIKEALHNIVKHAAAGEVWLRATVTNTGLQMSIEDNGRGFAPAPENPLADGLRNMRERLKEIGGLCTIESQPGVGTKIRIVLPWRKD